MWRIVHRPGNTSYGLRFMEDKFSYFYDFGFTDSLLERFPHDKLLANLKKIVCIIDSFLVA